MRRVIAFVMAFVVTLSLTACKTVPEAEKNTAAPTGLPESITGELTTYKRAEFERYNSPAEENGLQGDMIYIEGETSPILKSEGMLMTTVVDGDKNAWLCVFAYEDEDEDYKVNSDKIQVLSKKDIVLMGYYVGFSEDMQMPSILCYEVKVKDTGEMFSILDFMTEANAATVPPKAEPTSAPTSAPTPTPVPVLCDKGGIKISFSAVKKDTFHTIQLLIENNSGTDLTFRCEDFSLNGYMMRGSLHEKITNGKKAYADIILLSKDLEVLNGDSWKTCEFSIEGYNSEYDTVFDSGTLTVHF